MTKMELEEHDNNEYFPQLRTLRKAVESLTTSNKQLTNDKNQYDQLLIVNNENLNKTTLYHGQIETVKK